MQGFFADSVLLQSDNPKWLSARCGICKLCKSCETPKFPVYGRGAKSIMLVGSMPTEDEDEEGQPCVDAAGAVVKQQLRRLGVDLFKDCWYTYAAICNGRGKQTKRNDAVDYCRPNLFKAIEDHSPNVIILLGKSACRGLLYDLWDTNIGELERWVGWRIPSQSLNSWVCPTYHPNDLARSKNEAMAIWFARHLKAAVKLAESKPWSSIPDYESMVELVYDPEQAAAVVRKMGQKRGTVAFDYETNCLKPDAKHSRIVSCAVSFNGKKTIAFPWIGEAVKATGELLVSDLPKIAANMKFEDRWSRKEFGRPVRNWVWDTMQNAHILDNRKGITSLKFQAFVQFGFEKYNKHIDQFFEADNGYAVNRIDEIELKDLLLYNGLDALLEYELAVKQARMMGCEDELYG